jgi:hypothetical protein
MRGLTRRHRKKVPDTLRYAGTSGLSRREYDDLADTVLAVLSNPGDNPARGPEIDRLVAAGRMIDAIALIRAQKGLGLTEAKEAVEEI